ncbi:MAG TPA: hypothetical protein VKM55_08615 [Candidatus Lokiarchaeia archaeon]|nr:hypothetical protein [Candidatus Lokiarchaeia archaeon]
MPESQFVTSHDFSETITHIASNGGEKQPLFSFQVEGKQDIQILDASGESVSLLSGHSSPVTCHDWISTDILSSASADGEIRSWMARGARFDCTKMKEAFSSPAGISGIRSAKKLPPLVLLWYSENNLILIENGKPVGEKKQFPGKILGAAGSDDDILVLHVSDDGLVMEALDKAMESKKTRTFTHENGILFGEAIKVGPSASGFIMLDENGHLVAGAIDEDKIHVLDAGEQVSSFFVDHDSSTIFIGMKNGKVETRGIRPDFSFTDTITSFDAHEFRITSIAFIKKELMLVIGGLDGVAKFYKISSDCLNKRKTQEKKELDWKEQERVENKLRIAEDAIAKGNLDRAKEVLSAMKQGNFPGLGPRIEAIEASMQSKVDSKQARQSEKQRLVAFLEDVAKDRGEILLDEISVGLSMPKESLKHLIKSMNEEMDWEYNEEYECLFLFDRAFSIAKTTEIEREIAKGNEYNARYTQRRQLGRDGRGRQPERRPSRPPQRLVSRANPQPAPRPRPAESSMQDVNELRKLVPRVKGQMKAMILDPSFATTDIIGLPNLSELLEHYSKSAKFIITDGIISPRLATQAENLDVKIILGQRIHPNLDRSKLKVQCLEFDEIGQITIPQPERDSSPRRETQPHRRASSSPANEPSAGLESKLSGTLSGDTWKTADEIFRDAGIKDAFDTDLARIKLKQMAASGKITSEAYNGMQYYKKATRKK